jgi:hypothetical protein
MVGGCSTVDEGDGIPTLGAPEQQPLSDDAATPSFTSEWALEFTSAYRNSTSDLQRRVLEDETISDQELLALQDDYRGCLEARGFSDISFDRFGGYSLLPPDGMSDTGAGEVLQECGEATWGPRELTYSLYFQIYRNPSHQDEASIVTDCLVREGIVDEGYTSEDYRRDASQATLPFDASDPVAQACFSDPLSAGAQ